MYKQYSQLDVYKSSSLLTFLIVDLEALCPVLINKFFYFIFFFANNK